MKMTMKAAMLFVAIICSANVFAQKDSVTAARSNDTIRIGGIIILKKGDTAEKKHVIVSVGRPHRTDKNRVRTVSFIFGMGFSNWSDHTNYATATTNHSLVNQPGASNLSGKDFNLRTGKSINVNLLLVGQKVSLVKHQLNLKYGIGLDLNNYRFRSNISFSEGGFNPYNSAQDISHAFVYRDEEHFTKNKLAADYITVPVLLDFTSNPGSYGSSGVTLSAGISMGYLYSARNKQKSDESGKKKNRGDYDIEKWKFSYVGELGVGPVHLYGSYSPKSMFKNDLNFRPYTIGIRFVGWGW